MKVFAAVISFVLLLQYSKCLGAVASNLEDLEAASDHGHETGLSAKEKRCHEPLQLPLYNPLLGAKLLPSTLKRRNIPSFNNEMVQMQSRFRPDESESGLSEAQERYYTVGSFGPGPKQQVLAKLLSIPQNVNLDRLVVLAKNKSKVKPMTVPHPVVIDTAHVFTINEGKPTELDLELHGVKGDQNEDINSLTNQLNKELDAAIDTKKSMLGDSHLTPQEIDKIIDHVVDQLKKKNDKETVGNTMDLTRIPDSELEDDLEGFKKKKSKKGHKKHGIVDESDDVVGDEAPTEESLNFNGDMAEIPTDTDHALSENEAMLGTKKGKGYGLSKLHGKGYGKGKGKGGYHRQNVEIDGSEDMEDIRDDNPLHADISEELTGMETPIDEQSQKQKDIEELLEQENPVGEIGHIEKLTDKKIDGEMNDKEHNSSILGTLFKHKGYGKGDYDDGGYGMGSYGKGGYGKGKGLSLKGFGKKKKGYYRENEEEPQLGSHGPYETAQFQEGYAPSDPQGAQYAPASNPTQYMASQPTYEQTYQDYPQAAPASAYEQVEPETYHGVAPAYPAPQSDNHYQSNYKEPQTYTNQAYPEDQEQYQQAPLAPQQAYQTPQVAYEQPTYQQPQEHQQSMYQQPQNQQQFYQQPQQYQPMPAQAASVYQSAPQHQAAYSSSKNYKSVDVSLEEDDNEKTDDTAAIVGKPQDVPEDPTLKATFFENEVNRLRQWISENGGQTSPAKQAEHEESAEKEELVDKFTKVIEKDLTDGKKLTPMERKNLDKKIAKMVRDNLNEHDNHDAESKSRKKLDKLEELVEEEADENEESDGQPKLGSNMDDFKSRFTPKTENDEKDEEASPKKRKFGNGLDLLKASLDNLKMEMSTIKPLSGKLPTQKPVIDLKHIVEDLKSMPNTLMNGAGKLADMIKSNTEAPKLGQRLGTEDAEHSEKSDAIVGQTNDPKEKTAVEKEDETVGCFDKDDDDYDAYRAAGKENGVLENLDKLLHPKHAHKSSTQHPEHHERSGEEEEVKTLPEIIKQLEENIEEKLHLPPLSSLPNMREGMNSHHRRHHTQPPQVTPSNIPKIQVNGEQFVPNPQNIRPKPPLPEMPPRGLPQPTFQSRNFQESHGPQHFDMPIPNQNRPMNFQGFNQQQQQPFVGAPQPMNRPAQLPQHDMTHFGKIVPEHLHNIHVRDVSDHMKKHRMYFIGDGIKLPLHMHRDEDGSFHLSVDLQKLCGKCNVTDCKTHKEVKEPEFIHTNILGSSADNKHQNEENNMEEEGMNIEDVPLMMKTPNFDEMEEDSESKEKHLTKRSPRFNYIDMKTQHSSEEKKTDEKHDYMTPLAQAIKKDVEHKIDTFNKDIKQYYQNEADIKKHKLDNAHNDLTGFFEKRVGLLTNILGMLNEVTFEDKLYEE